MAPKTNGENKLLKSFRSFPQQRRILATLPVFSGFTGSPRASLHVGCLFLFRVTQVWHQVHQRSALFDRKDATGHLANGCDRGCQRGLLCWKKRLFFFAGLRDVWLLVECVLAISCEKRFQLLGNLRGAKLLGVLGARDCQQQLWGAGELKNRPCRLEVFWFGLWQLVPESDSRRRKATHSTNNIRNNSGLIMKHPVKIISPGVT